MAQYKNIYTYDNIQKLKLATVPDTLDKREGSVIWTTIAANSAEMALAFIQMQVNQDNCFPDTADREHLIRHCALRGITPKPATYAKIQGVFYSNVTEGAAFNPDVGTRFTVQNSSIIFKVTKQISDGNWELECETAGTVGNILSGMLIPIDEIQALGSASIVAILDQAEDDESTESLRIRYMESLKAQSFAGNKSAYREMTKSIENVGACKVYRAYNNAGGHVGLCILNAELGIPSSELVSEVQSIIDPTQDGEGVGMAPIDHIVTVFGATESTVNISLKVTPANSSTAWSNISQSVTEVIESYFTELKKTWDTTDKIIVRPSQIIARVLNLDMVLDVTECKVNDGTSNVQLGENEIPKVGVISGEIVQSA